MTRIAHAFRSGMSRSKDFWAAAAAGVPIGVVANEMPASLVLIGIPRFLRAGGHLFIDSGAFAELATGAVPDFDAVLGVYEAVADADLIGFNGGQLYVVAPDKVGDQLETLNRLSQYATRVRALIDLGCKVIVPLQRGVMPASEMLSRAVAILGTDRFVAGIPSNKEALSMVECATLKHHAFHILGRVQMNQDQIDRLNALATQNASAVITADANWLRSRIGIVSDLGKRERQARILAPSRASHLLPPVRSVAITAAIRSETVWAQ